MEADPSLGFAVTDQGTHVQILARRNGGAVIVDLRTLSEIRLDAAQLDELRELLDRAAMPGQPTSCAYCEDDPDHEDPDNAGTCTCQSPGCGRGWCPHRDALAEIVGEASGCCEHCDHFDPETGTDSAVVDDPPPHAKPCGFGCNAAARAVPGAGDRG